MNQTQLKAGNQDRGKTNMIQQTTKSNFVPENKKQMHQYNIYTL